MNSNQTHLTVTRTIDAPAKDLFDLLTLPARHHEFDGSGTVRSADDTERIDKSGEKFVMNMHREAMGGDYRTHNFVTAYDENKMIGWKPAPEGEDGTAPEGPLGWEWLYTLTSQGAGTTEVSLTYDWSAVDKALQEKVGFPAIPHADLEESLNLLAAAVTRS